MRLLHTMIRVIDLNKSIEFYTQILGMKLLRRKDYEAGRFTLAFVGYQAECSSTVIELTHNWDRKSYDIGDGFGHIAIGVNNIYKTCEIISESGGNITRKPGPMKNSNSLIAFLEDPDGYKIELIQKNN